MRSLAYCGVFKRTCTGTSILIYKQSWNKVANTRTMKKRPRNDYYQQKLVKMQSNLFFVHADLIEPITVKLLQRPKVGTGHKLAGCCVSVNVQNPLVPVLVNNSLAKTGFAVSAIALLAGSESPSFLAVDTLSPND